MRNLEAGSRIRVIEPQLEDLFERVIALEEAIFEPMDEKIVELAEYRLPDLAAKSVHINFGRYMPMVPLAKENMTKELAEEMADEYNERMKNG